MQASSLNERGAVKLLLMAVGSMRVCEVCNYDVYDNTLDSGMVWEFVCPEGCASSWAELSQDKLADRIAESGLAGPWKLGRTLIG